MKCLANELFPFQAVYRSGKAGPRNSLISSYSKPVKENSNSLVMQSYPKPKRGVFLAALGFFSLFFFKSRLDLLQTLALAQIKVFLLSTQNQEKASIKNTLKIPKNRAGLSSSRILFSQGSGLLQTFNLGYNHEVCPQLC